MKVAIITTHRANNFGAMLQAYSLVSTCIELGADARILDWRCPHFEWLYHTALRFQRNPLTVLKHFVWYWTKEKPSRIMFEEFRNKIPKSNAIKRRSDLCATENEYDIFIVGSDQVWNPINSSNDPFKFDRTNLLDFVQNKKKYAYAASIGTKEIYPPSLCPEFIGNWVRFTGITMREHAGAAFVSKMTGRSVPTVVDPVLLQGSQFWANVKSRNIISGKFALFYGVRSSCQLKILAENYAKKEGISFVDLLIPGVVTRGDGAKINAGPGEFISYIESAECVFTGSFHAAAFSLLFSKKLFLQTSKLDDNVNSRLETLFYWGGLKGEKIFESEEIKISFYDCANKNTQNLESERHRCREILAGMVNGTY